MYRGGIFHGDRVALFGDLDRRPVPAVTDPARVLLVAPTVTVEEWRRRAACVEAATGGGRDSWANARRYVRADEITLVSAASPVVALAASVAVAQMLSSTGQPRVPERWASAESTGPKSTWSVACTDSGSPHSSTVSPELAPEAFSPPGVVPSDTCSAAAEAAVELAAWSTRLEELSALGPGPELAAHVASRPETCAVAERAEWKGAGAFWGNVVLDSVVARRKLISWLQAQNISDLAALSGNYVGLHEFLPAEVGLALGLSDSEANYVIYEAERLARVLPNTLSALERGLLSFEKARAMDRATRTIDDDIAGIVETDVLNSVLDTDGSVCRFTVRGLQDRCRRSIIRHDPAGAKARHRRSMALRGVSKSAGDDGMAYLNIHTSALDVAAIWETLTALADQAKTPGDDRTLAARRVDCLADLCKDVLTAGEYKTVPLPKHQGRKPEVQVVMPLSATVGGNDPCELVGYGAITADQARTVAADAVLRRLVCDPVTGVLLDYGRTRYQPPPSLRDHVLTRDQTCVMPGCSQPAWRGQLDHIEPFHPGQNEGGTTSADNLGSPCQHHHRAKDGGGFTLNREENGTFRWVTPLGRSHTRPPVKLWEPMVSTSCRTPEIGYPAALAAAEEARTAACHAAGFAVARFDWAELAADTDDTESDENSCSIGKPDKTTQVQDWFDQRMTEATAARDHYEHTQQLERDFINDVALYLYGPDALDHHTPIEPQIVPQVSISHQHREIDDNPPPF